MALNQQKKTGLLASAALLLAFGAGYGVRAQNEPEWLPQTQAFAPLPTVRLADGGLMLSAASPRPKNTAPVKPSLKMYETIAEVRGAIKNNFVHKNIDENELTYGAIRGMLRSLGDKFTRFLTPEDFAKFNEQTNAEFVGIGARIDVKDDYIGSPAAAPINASRPYIFEPIEGGPAAKAGLQKDDVILAINGKSTADKSADAVVNLIRGPQGSPVKLKIERKTKAAALNRDSVYKVFDISLTRNVIEVHPVKLEWLPNRVAWMKLDEFNNKSDAEVTKALAQVKKGPDGQGAASGLIFDMRDNPGGLLDVAVKIGSRFVADGPIVYTRERDGSEEHLDAQRDRYLNLKMPIIVLVNNYSASAAEVVTGALKDDGVATVVGEQSYGKASVQVLLRLKNGGALIITTAKYLTPAKRDISDKGITPDVVVKASAEDEKTGRGAQLDRAVALIREKNNLALAAVTKP